MEIIVERLSALGLQRPQKTTTFQTLPNALHLMMMEKLHGPRDGSVYTEDRVQNCRSLFNLGLVNHHFHTLVTSILPGQKESTATHATRAPWSTTNIDDLDAKMLQSWGERATFHLGQFLIGILKEHPAIHAYLFRKIPITTVFEFPSLREEWHIKKLLVPATERMKPRQLYWSRVLEGKTVNPRGPYIDRDDCQQEPTVALAYILQASCGMYDLSLCDRYVNVQPRLPYWRPGICGQA